jgi:uncharacterized protein YggE
MKRLAMFIGVMMLAIAGSNAVEGNPTITVISAGSVSVPADTVGIAVTAESSNRNITLAAEEVEAELSGALDALKEAGVKEEEIFAGQSSSFSSGQSLSSVCRTVNNTTTCEEVSSNATSLVRRSVLLQLRATDEARINEVLSAARSSGASASVSGYGLSDPSAAAGQAFRQAVQNARDKAEASGAKLGKELDIYEYAPPSISESTSPTGQKVVEVTAYVIVTYEIL